MGLAAEAVKVSRYNCGALDDMGKEGYGDYLNQVEGK